jgi:hypothetical protein
MLRSASLRNFAVRADAVEITEAHASISHVRGVSDGDVGGR